MSTTSQLRERIDRERLHGHGDHPPVSPSPSLIPTNLFAAEEAILLSDFDDPNVDRDEALAGILGTTHSLAITTHFTEPLLEDDSPYPEVCSAVANTDDPNIPVNTFRAWLIGSLLPYFK
jgi:hypothetical protein